MRSQAIEGFFVHFFWYSKVSLGNRASYTGKSVTVTTNAYSITYAVLKVVAIKECYDSLWYSVLADSSPFIRITNLVTCEVQVITKTCRYFAPYLFFAKPFPA